MEKEIKPLLIKSNNKGRAISEADKWVSMESADSFTRNIETAKTSEKTSLDVFNTLISGVPSPWARVKLTDYALSQDFKANCDDSSLLDFYKQVRGEWRGLFATYILFSDRFTISDPIPLVGESMEKTTGRLEVRNILGQMLFNEQDFWRHSSDQDESPMIQLLYYKSSTSPDRELVGATSPFSIFFASSNYRMQRDKDVYWVRDGKFCDPTSFTDADKYVDNMKKIILVLKDIITSCGKYEDALYRIVNDRHRVKLVSECISKFANAWIGEISEKCPEVAKLEKLPVSINASAKPSGPLASLFDIKYTYYYDNGDFYMKPKETQAEVSIDDVQKIFIDSKYIAAIKSTDADESKYENAPVFYLKAKDYDNGQVYFCALPLSRKSIDEYFNNSLHKIIKGTEKSYLEAIVRYGKLTVSLKANINQAGWVDIASREYILSEPDFVRNVISWPNFKSEYWKAYYYYSEYPQNDSGINAVPIFQSVGNSDVIDFSILSQDSIKKNTKVNYIVTYPAGKVDASEHRYEIIRSDYPLKMVQLMDYKDGQKCIIGFLVLRNRDENAINGVEMKTRPHTKVRVGIDFGSTNTCAYYHSDKETESKPIPFTNRRLYLWGFENKSKGLAQKNELLFISNEEPINGNGQIKTWLHRHNELFINPANKGEALVGGIPVNETNIMVKAMNENFITTNAGLLCCNMKWLPDEEGKKLRASFLRTVWLMICADLFDEGFEPSELNWSYPSAMSSPEITDMNAIFEMCLREQHPILPIGNYPALERHTESEAVCRYAISNAEKSEKLDRSFQSESKTQKGYSLEKDNIVFGIDIGGSTSDILIMGLENGQISLLSQCSIRMAAGQFFNAINLSSKFRKALYGFHESNQTAIKVINIDDIISDDRARYTRAPYYLNSVFDQLKSSDEFLSFYYSLYRDVPFVFTLPSYITGALVFYSGIQVHKTIMDKNLEGTIKQVYMNYYGKGGRTFEWIFGVYGNKAKEFYARCFQAGFGSDDVEFICANADAIRSNNATQNKTEVARGLVSVIPVNGIYESNGVSHEFKTEVFGEKGFRYTDHNGIVREISELSISDGEFYKNIDRPVVFENFERFLGIYTNFIESNGIIRDKLLVQTLLSNCNVVRNVKNFFDNDPEYIEYLKNTASGVKPGTASYRMPMFIAEALYYMKIVLLPVVFKE